jgi:DNA-binding NarL/FixJ family response regulator
MKTTLENVIKIAAVTAGVIVLYEISTQLLIYKYFRFDYYISTAVITAFLVGVILTRKYIMLPKENPNRATLLTAKECRVLEMVAEGKTNKEIAIANFVELSTVKTHINKIYAKLEVKNRREAINVFRSELVTQKSTFFPPSSV